MKVTDEYRRKHRSWNVQAHTGEVSDAKNPLFIFSRTDSELLERVVSGELDAKQLAMLELENRRPHIRTYSIYNSRGRKIKVTISD